MCRWDSAIRRQVKEEAIRLLAVETGIDGLDHAETDWIARLETVEAMPTAPIQPESALQQKAGTSTPPTDQQPLKSNPSAGSEKSALQTKVLTDGQKQPFSGQTATPPPEGARCVRCGCVLCACHRERKTAKPTEIVLGGTETGVDPMHLFRGLTDQNKQFWRQQVNDEADERNRLVREYLSQQAKNHF